MYSKKRFIPKTNLKELQDILADKGNDIFVANIIHDYKITSERDDYFRCIFTEDVHTYIARTRRISRTFLCAKKYKEMTEKIVNDMIAKNMTYETSKIWNEITSSRVDLCRDFIAEFNECINWESFLTYNFFNEKEYMQYIFKKYKDIRIKTVYYRSPKDHTITFKTLRCSGKNEGFELELKIHAY